MLRKEKVNILVVYAGERDGRKTSEPQHIWLGSKASEWTFLTVRGGVLGKYVRNK